MSVFFIFLATFSVTIAQCFEASTVETCTARAHVKMPSLRTMIALELPQHAQHQRNNTIMVLPQPSPNRVCRMSVSRTIKGLSIKCSCHEGSSAVPAEIITGISHSCVKSCVHTPSLIETCESGNLRTFQSLAKSTRDSCCMNRCNGLVDGETCVRTGPFSAPTRTSSSSCVVSFPVQPYGDQLACSCEGRVVVASPIIYSGVVQSCVALCVRRRIERICKPNKSRSEILNGMFDAFGACCVHCRGVALDGGLACGARA